MSSSSKVPLAKAAAVMIAGMLLIPLGDSAGKLLTGDAGVEPIFVAWSRFALGALLVVAVMRGKGFDLTILKDWRVWLRASFMFCAVIFILTALKTQPLSNVFAAFFIGPIISYFAAFIFLKEPISRGRTGLLFIGFIGVIAVVKPGMTMAPAMGYAVLAGVCYGLFLMSSKWLSDISNPRSLLLSQMLIAALVLLPMSIQTFPEMTRSNISLILLSAIASAIGNLFLIIANRLADATRLAPLVYMQLVSATVLGFLLFQERPDKLSIIGLCLLLGSGLAGFMLGPQAKNNAQTRTRGK